MTKKTVVCVSRVLVLGVLALCLGGAAGEATAAPTDGWTQTSWSYTVHKPSNLSLSARFKYTSGVWYTWVYKTDKCMHTTCSSTDGKRSELRWNNNYTSGNRMWDSDMYMVSGTHEATV